MAKVGREAKLCTVHTSGGLCPHSVDRDTKSKSREAESWSSAETLWPVQGPERPRRVLYAVIMTSAGSAAPYQAVGLQARESLSAPLQPRSVHGTGGHGGGGRGVILAQVLTLPTP